MIILGVMPKKREYEDDEYRDHSLMAFLKVMASNKTKIVDSRTDFFRTKKQSKKKNKKTAKYILVLGTKKNKKKQTKKDRKIFLKCFLNIFNLKIV